MRVVSPEILEGRLNELIDASGHARAVAAAAVARSASLCQVTRGVQRRALASRMASRPHRAYLRLLGVVDGRDVGALVRTDGGVAGDRLLLRQAELLVAMGDEFDGETRRVRAALGEDALSSALTLIRACDRVRAVELAVAVRPATGAPGPDPAG